MTTLAARIARDHQPTTHGCTCGKHLAGPKCARGTLTPFIAHVVEVTQEKVAAEIERNYPDEQQAQAFFAGMSHAALMVRNPS